jgi:hypothetical protein
LLSRREINGDGREGDLFSDNKDGRRIASSRNAPERVGDLPSQGSLGTLFGRQLRIALNPAGSALAEASLGGSDTLGMVAMELHIHSHLLIGGAASEVGGAVHLMQQLGDTHRRHRRIDPVGEAAGARWGGCPDRCDMQSTVAHLDTVEHAASHSVGKALQPLVRLFPSWK